MRLRKRAAALAGLLAAAPVGGAWAQEKAREKGAAGAPAAGTASPSSAAEKALRAHIAAGAQENEGLYMLYDEEADMVRYLKLKGLEARPVRRLSDSKVILRADFLQPGDPEEGLPDERVLVDFTMEREKGGSWHVSEEAVYSVDGQQRFSYRPDGRRQPAPGWGGAEADEEDSEPSEDGEAVEF